MKAENINWTMPEDYYPPKDLANAVWGSCFDYKNIDSMRGGKSIRERVKEACFRIEQLRKLEEAE